MVGRIPKYPNRPDPVLESPEFRQWIHELVRYVDMDHKRFSRSALLDAAAFDPKYFRTVPTHSLEILTRGFLGRPSLRFANGDPSSDVFEASGFVLFRLYPDLVWSAHELKKRFIAVKNWMSASSDTMAENCSDQKINDIIGILERYRTAEIHNAGQIRRNLLTLEVCSLKLKKVIDSDFWPSLAAGASLATTRLSSERYVQLDEAAHKKLDGIIREMKELSQIETGSSEKLARLQLLLLQTHVALLPDTFNPDAEPASELEKNPEETGETPEAVDEAATAVVFPLSSKLKI